MLVTDYQPVSLDPQANMTASERRFSLTILPSINEDETDIFHDTTESPEDEYHTYFDEDTKQLEYLRYYDPKDNIPTRILHGKAVPLSLDCSSFVRKNDLNSLIDNLNDDDLFGKNIPFDSFSHINENNMYVMANKTEIIQDIGIKDENLPT